MKTNKNNLYIQLWRNPIFYDLLLMFLTPTNLHTLIGLSVFMDEEGCCNPSQGYLKSILGLTDIGSVSRRVTALEKVKFKGKSVLTVERSRKVNEKGNIRYANNRYRINQKIVSIFTPHKKTLVRRKRQMEKINKMREEVKRHMAIPTNERKTT